MNPDQKAGTLIVVTAATLIALTLVLSVGWGNPNFDLQLAHFEYKSDEGGTDYFIVYTRYVLAALIAVVGYGIARYFGVIPIIYRKTKPSKNT